MASVSGTWKRIVFVMAAFSLAWLPQAVRAEGHNSQATLGSRGNEVRVVECPAGEILSGFAGRKGAAIDQIQILCSPLLAGGGIGAPHPVHDRYGGFGGGEAPPVACRGNSRIAGAGVALDSTNTWVAQTSLKCVDPKGTLVETLYFGGGSNMRTDCTSVIVTWCSDKVGATAEYRCPDEYFTGIRVRFDTGVRGMGYLCDRRNAPQPAAAPPPPKPIKATGKAKAPTLVLRLTIQGPWKLAMGDEHYNLLLTASGDGMMMGRDELPFAVIGQLSSPDGSADGAGSFSANMLPTRQLVGGYGQKNGAGGNCALNYAADGKSLTGDCARGKESIRWTATRGTWPASAPQRVDRAALRTVAVKLDVDVYAAPGGNGQPIAELGAGTADVTLVETCKNDWCHVRWGDKEGWVYSGPDYNSLGR